MRGPALGAWETLLVSRGAGGFDVKQDPKHPGQKATMSVRSRRLLDSHHAIQALSEGINFHAKQPAVQATPENLHEKHQQHLSLEKLAATDDPHDICAELHLARMSPKHQVQKVGKAGASKNTFGPECRAVLVPSAEISLHAKQPPLRMIPHAVHPKLQQIQLHLLLPATGQ